MSAAPLRAGRAFDEIGAHVYGYNRTSIGICMIGTERFTIEQWRSLARVIELLRLKYQAARVCGHRDLSPDVNSDGLVEPWEWAQDLPGVRRRRLARRGHATGL
jgi:N-acetyl-anhydromuramyl-L-alanine amidase AmpD